MARFRRGGPRIKTDKHEVTWSHLQQDSSAIQNVVIVTGVAPSGKNTATECVTGNHVQNIYFEFNVSPDTVTVPAIVHWRIAMRRTGQTLSSPALYYQDDRAQTMKRGMEMLGQSKGIEIKRIISLAIPRVYQRVREDSDIVFSYISSSSQVMNLCGFAIYKEHQ